MLPKIFVSALGAAAVVSAAAIGGSCPAKPPKQTCNADNCLRALRAVSPKTRLAQAQADCAAWMVATVTPPVVTVTASTTISSTETVVEQITQTESVFQAFTSTVRETPTETVYTSTTTVTVDPLTLKKRAASPTIPLYASACSGAIRYTSACSCIGVTAAPSIVTLPASTTTVTEPTTAWETVSETVAVVTSTVTIIDATVTETVTEPATTVSLVATVTETKSAEPTPTSLKLALEIEGHAPGYITNFDSSSLSYAVFTAEESQAISLSLHPDGTLWFGSKVAKGDPNGSTLQFFFVEPQVATIRQPFTCTIDANNVMKCSLANGVVNAMGLRLASGSSEWVYSGREQNLRNVGMAIITLKPQLS